ncbi:MAG: NlpC/P60 family protein [Thermodesulfobacteriota bacterium]
MNSTAYKITTVTFILALICTGCGNSAGKGQARELSGSSKVVSLKSSKSVKKQLYSQYKEWKGVRYKANGLSKKGIDCSGFVHLTFRDKLDRKIPRTTSQLSRLGSKISRKQLRAGDLVFFKTGIKIRHVGIYVEKGKFLHASSSKGVIISRLDNVYWQKHFWHARRV